MNNRSRTGRSLFDNRTVLIVFSVISAIIFWFVVSFQINTTRTATVRDVRVSLSQNASVYQSIGLDIIERVDETVDIGVSGDINVIGNLDPSDFVVTPNYASVKEAGVYELDLTVSKVNQLADFEITSVSPSTVELRFDNAVSRKFTVSIEGIGHAAAQGYMIDTMVSSPAEVTVTGPENEVDGIARVVAECRLDTELDETTRVTCPVKLLDAAGNEITSSVLRLDVTEVDVTIPVYKRGTLPLDIGFTNIPDGFDVGTVEYLLSHSSIEVAASERVIDNMTTRIIGYIDLATFKLGDSYIFELQLPTGMVNLDNVETVTVTFPRADLNTKRVVVEDIRVENAPAAYNINVVTELIYDVTVIGPPADVEALLPGSVVAVVNMDTLSVQSGSYNVPVSFHVTANNTTWVVGSYTVTIEVEPK